MLQSFIKCIVMTVVCGYAAGGHCIGRCMLKQYKRTQMKTVKESREGQVNHKFHTALKRLLHFFSTCVEYKTK